MAHSLGLKVTAEGVETAAEADYLTALECDSLQGYLFSLPVSGWSAPCITQSKP